MVAKKLHILLLTIAGLMLANTSPIPEHIDNCFKEMKITDKEIQQKILADPNFQFADQQCFSKCILFSAGMINKDGMILPEGARQLAAAMKGTISEEQIVKCQEYASKNGKNACDVADLGAGCILQTTSKN